MDVQLLSSKHKPTWTSEEKLPEYSDQQEKSNFNDTETLLQYVTETAPSRGKRGLIQVMRAECSNQCVYLIDIRVWTGSERRALVVGGPCEVSIRHVQLRQNVNNHRCAPGTQRWFIVILSKPAEFRQTMLKELNISIIWSKLKSHNFFFFIWINSNFEKTKLK